MVTRSKSFIILIKVLGLIWVSSLYACGCRNKGGEGKPNGTEVSRSLRMQIPGKFLLGDSKNIEVTLRCTDDQKPAILEDFRLHVAIIQENGKNSQIAYHGYVNGQPSSIKKPVIEESIIHFSNLEQLTPTDDPLKIAFTLMPDPQINKVVTIFKLLDAQGQVVDEERVTWEKEKPSIDILLTRISSEHLRGDRNVKIEIKNQGSQKIEAGQAKLKITRKVGTDVPIIDAVATATPGEYEFKLGELKPGENILQNLKITPETDVNLQLTFQVAYSDSYLSNQVSFDWSQDIQLVLEEIKCNKDTHVITYTIKNTGMDVAKNLQIEYVSKTAGIKLDGVELLSGKPQIYNLGELAAGVTKENQVLGQLDFNGNQSAEFEFSLVYGAERTAAQSYSFHAEDIQLSINKLTYNSDTGLVTYSLKNTGSVKAENLKLRYTNISDQNNLEGKTALLENVTVSTINIGDIPGNNGKTGDRELKLDLKYADEATFKFELLYNETPITQEEKIATFKAKPVKFKLVPTTSCLLIGSKQEIKCKIEVEADGRHLSNIDCSKLSLIISNLLENEARISRSGEVTHVMKLTGNELGAIGNDIALDVHPEKAKKASFRLALNYQGKPVEDAPSIDITWQEASLMIVGADNFQDDDTYHFKLENTNSGESIDTKSITIELISNNEAKFVLVDKNDHEIGTSVTLHQLIGINLLSSNTLTNPIPFKLADAHGNNKATVAIIVKRGDVELAKHEVIWEKQEFSIELKIQKHDFKDEDLITFDLKNAGTAINNTDKIRIEITNNQGVKFKLSDIIGDQIKTNLKDILKKDQLKKEENVNFVLQLEGNPQDVYGTELTIEILDNKGNLLNGDVLRWTNQDKLYLDLGLREISEIVKEFEDLKKGSEVTKDKPFLWYQAIEQITTNQPNLKEAINDMQNNFKNISNQKKLMDDTKAKVSNQIIPYFHNKYEEINRYILESLAYAKQQVELFVKASQVTGKQQEDGANNKKEQELMKTFWLGVLMQLVEKINTEEAREILKEVEKSSAEVEEIISTPSKKEKILKDTNEEIGKTPKKDRKASRKLFDEAYDFMFF